MAFFEFMPTQPLYHYTSEDGFKGIFTSKSLWLADLALTNDPRELKMGFEWLLPMLEAASRSEYAEQRSSFLTNIADMMRRYVTKVDVFCACLSLTEDSLPMWRAYAADYSGLSIEFRSEALQSVPGRVQKVEYIAEDTKSEFQKMIFDHADRIQATYSPDNLLFWLDAVASIFSSLTTVKHFTWSYEQEIRISYTQLKEQPPEYIPASEFSDGKQIPWSSPIEKPRRHMSFKFGCYENGQANFANSISSVTLGPKCRISTTDVANLMRENGFVGCAIKRSNCQIR